MFFLFNSIKTSDSSVKTFRVLLSRVRRTCDRPGQAAKTHEPTIFAAKACRSFIPFDVPNWPYTAHAIPYTLSSKILRLNMLYFK